MTARKALITVHGKLTSLAQFEHLDDCLATDWAKRETAATVEAALLDAETRGVGAVFVIANLRHELVTTELLEIMGVGYTLEIPSIEGVDGLIKTYRPGEGIFQARCDKDGKPTMPEEVEGIDISDLVRKATLATHDEMPPFMIADEVRPYLRE